MVPMLRETGVLPSGPAKTALAADIAGVTGLTQDTAELVCDFAHPAVAMSQDCHRQVCSAPR
jgi:hypothetical protein